MAAHSCSAALLLALAVLLFASSVQAAGRALQVRSGTALHWVAQAGGEEGCGTASSARLHLVPHVRCRAALRPAHPPQEEPAVSAPAPALEAAAGPGPAPAPAPGAAALEVAVDAGAMLASTCDTQKSGCLADCRSLDRGFTDPACSPACECFAVFRVICIQARGGRGRRGLGGREAGSRCSSLRALRLPCCPAGDCQWYTCSGTKPLPEKCLYNAF